MKHGAKVCNLTISIFNRGVVRHCGGDAYLVVLFYATAQVDEVLGDEIQLLVTDVVMPVMGGCHLARQLAELRPNLQVLFVSGYTDKAIVQHGVLDNGTPFLQKPFTTEALARKVREVLDRTRQN